MNSITSWLFGTPTRAIETVSCAMLWGFAVILLCDPRMLDLPTRHAFLDRWTLIVVFVAVGSICAACLAHRTSNALYCAGYTMLIVAVIWSIIGAQYILSYPPMTLEMVTYPFFGLLSFLAGLYNIKQSNRERDYGMGDADR